MTTQRRAILLLSGGVDSATVLAMAARDGLEIYAISFRYGQRHEVELDAARQLARHYGVAQHIVVDIDPAVFGGAVLTGGGRRFGSAEAPATYVPARNTLFLAHAVAWAEAVGAREILLGPNADDAAGYPDCREPYLRAFERAAALGTQAGGGLAVRAPLIGRSKSEVVDLARSLGVPLEITWSCYFPTVGGRPCGGCGACVLRAGAGLG